MKYQLNNQLQTSIVTISRDLVNEYNIWPTCAMLKEVTNVNDSLIMQVLGELDYNDVGVQRYQVDFHAAALLGDTMKIESRYSSSGPESLHISVVIYKSKGKNKILALTGDFTFTLRKQQHLQQALADCA